MLLCFAPPEARAAAAAQDPALAEALRQQQPSDLGPCMKSLFQDQPASSSHDCFVAWLAVLLRAQVELDRGIQVGAAVLVC